MREGFLITLLFVVSSFFLQAGEDCVDCGTQIPSATSAKVSFKYTNLASNMKVAEGARKVLAKKENIKEEEDKPPHTLTSKEVSHLCRLIRKQDLDGFMDQFDAYLDLEDARDSSIPGLLWRDSNKTKMGKINNLKKAYKDIRCTILNDEGEETQQSLFKMFVKYFGNGRYWKSFIEDYTPPINDYDKPINEDSSKTVLDDFCTSTKHNFSLGVNLRDYPCAINLKKDPSGNIAQKGFSKEKYKFFNTMRKDLASNKKRNVYGEKVSESFLPDRKAKLSCEIEGKCECKLDNDTFICKYIK